MQDDAAAAVFSGSVGGLARNPNFVEKIQEDSLKFHPKTLGKLSQASKAARK
jgi:hypothetical protein